MPIYQSGRGCGRKNQRRILPEQVHRRTGRRKTAHEIEQDIKFESWMCSYDEIEEKLRKYGDDWFKDRDVSLHKSIFAKYENDGIFRFQGIKDFDLSRASGVLNENALVYEIENEIATNNELKSKVIQFFKTHNYISRPLLSCGACGIRRYSRDKTKYISVNLKSMPSFMKYSEDDVIIFNKWRDETKLTIPINDQFDTKEIDASEIVSVYKSQLTGELFHLHPELVDYNASENIESSYFCETCFSFIMKKDRKSVLSIANGIDFGCFHRIDCLTEPNIHEKAIIAKMRRYHKVVKIRSNMIGNVLFSGKRIQGHVSLFSHDAVEVAIHTIDEMISKDSIAKTLVILFVEPNGKPDHLIRETLGSTSIFARAFVVIQWLNLLEKVHRFYNDPPINAIDWNTVQQSIEEAQASIIEKSLQVDGREEAEQENTIGSDVANVIRTDASNLNRDNNMVQEEDGEEYESNQNSIPLIYSIVTDSIVVTPCDKYQVSEIEAIREAFGEDNTEECFAVQDNTTILHDTSNLVSTDSRTYLGNNTEPVSFRSETIWNDIEDRDEGISCSFPHIFLRGIVFNRSSGSLSQSQTEHILFQFHNIPAQDRELLAYLFDCKRRAQSCFGLKAQVKGNSKAFKEFVESFENNDFKIKLRAAFKNPQSKEAKKMVRQIENFLTIGGSKQQGGAYELSKLTCRVSAITKTIGLPSLFLTVAPDGKNNPVTVRLAYKSIDNISFPAQVLTGSNDDEELNSYIKKLIEGGNMESGSIRMPVGFEFRNNLAINNPVAQVVEFKELVIDILTILLGLPPESFYSIYDGDSSRKTKRYISRGKGIFGYTLAYYGVVEANSRGILHFHLLFFGSIPPEIMQQFASVPSVCKSISKTLNTIYRSTLSFDTMLLNTTKEIMRDRRMNGIPNVKLPTVPPPLFNKDPLNDILRNNNRDESMYQKIAKSVEIQSGQQQIHDSNHFPTCHKGTRGITGCRFCRPYGECKGGPKPVQLCCREVSSDGKYLDGDERNMNNYTIKDPPDNNEQNHFKNPLKQNIGNIIVWDFNRPRIEDIEDLSCTTLQDALQKFANLYKNLNFTHDGEFQDFLESMEIEDLYALYSNIKSRLIKAHGYVVEHSPALSLCTGSHNNTMLIGGAIQAKAAMHYLCSYLKKNKSNLEECVILFDEIEKKITKFPSVADDSGSPQRTAIHFLTALLNRKNCLIEVTDQQAVAALLNMPTQLYSHSFKYFDPKATLAYGQWETLKTMEEKNEEMVYLARNEELDKNDMLEYHNELNNFICEEESDSDSSNEDVLQAEGAKVTVNPDDFYHELGRSKIFVIDGECTDASTCKKIHVPVLYAEMYVNRGLALSELNREEYERCIDIKPKPKQDNEKTNILIKGRKSNITFPFARSFILFSNYIQVLRSKIPILILIGTAPQFPGNEPIRNNTPTYSMWKSKADAFAKYFLIMFRPELQHYDGIHSLPEVLYYDWPALKRWVNQLQIDGSWLANARLKAFQLRVHSLSVLQKDKDMICKYRERNRDLWTNKQQSEIANQLYLESRQRRQNNLDLDDHLYNETHKMLSSKVRTDVLKQMSDVIIMGVVLSNVTRTSHVIQHSGELSDRMCNNTKVIYKYYNSETHQTEQHYILNAVQNIKDMQEDVAFEENITNDSSRNFNFFYSSSSTQEITIPVLGYLKEGQQEVFRKIMDDIDKSTCPQETAEYIRRTGENRIYLVTGMAGTGKSLLLKAIDEAAKQRRKYFIKISYNAVIAYALNGNTLCSTFGFDTKVHSRNIPNLGSGKLSMLKGKLGITDNSLYSKISGIIIDEISTCSPQMIALVSKRLQEVFGVADIPFGGIVCLMAGDLGQNPPVKAISLQNAAIAVAMENRGLESDIKALCIMEKKHKKTYAKTYKANKQQPSKRCRTEKEDFFDKFKQGHPYRDGIDIFTKAKWFNLTEQVRSDDEEHTNVVKSMYEGKQISVQKIIQLYKCLSEKDFESNGSQEVDWFSAPVLVSTNRERHTVTDIFSKAYALNKQKIVIRWQRTNHKWEGMPKERNQLVNVMKDSAFYEIFVQGANGFITDNINKRLGLVNGAPIVYHSISYQNGKDEDLFDSLIKSTSIGGVCTLPENLVPYAINIIPADAQKCINKFLLIVEDKNQTEEQQQNAQEKLSEIFRSWQPFILPNDKHLLIVPLLAHRFHQSYDQEVKMIPVPGNVFLNYGPSKVEVKNHFPIEPAFAITVYKAQGKTLDGGVILALGHRQCPHCQMTYAAVYVALSRVRASSKIRLLLPPSGVESLAYIESLTPDPATIAFFHGYSNTNGSIWDPLLSLDKYNEMKNE